MPFRAGLMAESAWCFGVLSQACIRQQHMNAPAGALTKFAAAADAVVLVFTSEVCNVTNRTRK
jgi:hypothetical protein